MLKPIADYYHTDSKETGGYKIEKWCFQGEIRSDTIERNGNNVAIYDVQAELQPPLMISNEVSEVNTINQKTFEENNGSNVNHENFDKGVEVDT